MATTLKIALRLVTIVYILEQWIGSLHDIQIQKTRGEINISNSSTFLSKWMQSSVLAGGSSGTAVQRSQEKTQNNGLPDFFRKYPDKFF